MEQRREVIEAKSFINNEWVGSSTQHILPVKNKYDQSIVATVAMADMAEVQFAIESSVKGFENFKKLSGEERRQIILKIRDGLILEKEKFINLIVTEAGKPIDYAKAEIDRSVKTLEIAAEEALRMGGEVIPMDYGIGVGKTAFTKRFPVGPVLCISPFNFPLNLVMHKLAPALACGNSVILKPSPYTPLTALALASLLKRVGVPAGVFNVVVCKNEEAEFMLHDERIKMLSFTGSAEVGWMLKQKAKKKKILLELGGNAAVIVDRSSDIDLAAKEIARGAYLYSGQICISTQRIFVDASVFDEFIHRFKFHTSELKIGSPNESGVVIGPIIDRAHFDRIHHWVMEAQTLGAECLMGGKIIDETHHLYAPTLLTKTSSEMKVVCEEIFGPVAVIEKVEYFDEVIREINDSKYGLQVALYTNQLNQMKYAHEHLNVGALIINSIPGFRVDNMPYGGVKDSGFGREGVRYALEEMTESKLLVY